MKKLWHKNYTQEKQAEMYCFARSAQLDSKLIEADIFGSIAHAKMLTTIGILTEDEFLTLKKELLNILALFEKDEFLIGPEDEDVHTKIEAVLTEKVGDAAKKIHTARSRNDQVALDLHLFGKKELIELFEYSSFLTTEFGDFAQKHEFLPMPGYTHMQKAMPSSVGMWAGSFAESLIDDLRLLKNAFEITDASPLGAGASYGVSLPIDRQLVSDLLGFEKVQNNSLYTQTARVKFQIAIMHACSQIMITLSRFAEDMLLYTTSEYDLFDVDEKLCSGSSIMPQKKNLDIMEVLRARSHLVIGHTQTASSMISGLPSGYNVDFGETKELFMDSVEVAIESVEIVRLVLKTLTPNEKKMKESMTSDLFAAHAAYELVEKGMPFRDAYKKIGLSLDSLPEYDAVDVLKQSAHIGGPGNLQLKNISNEIKEQQIWWDKKKKHFHEALEKLKS